MAQMGVRQLEVHVVPRNMRWELDVRGVTRPMLDWFCSKERAVQYGVLRALDVGAPVIVVERGDRSVEQVIAVEGGHRKLA